MGHAAASDGASRTAWFWAHTKHLTYRHLTGPAKERLDALKKGRVDVSIINVEQVQWLVQQFVEARSSNKKPVLIKPWPFDVIIIDELSKLKDHSTGRFAALKMIRRSHADIWDGSLSLAARVQAEAIENGAPV